MASCIRCCVASCIEPCYVSVNSYAPFCLNTYVAVCASCCKAGGVNKLSKEVSGLGDLQRKKEETLIGEEIDHASYLEHICCSILNR